MLSTRKATLAIVAMLAVVAGMIFLSTIEHQDNSNLQPPQEPPQHAAPKPQAATTSQRPTAKQVQAGHPDQAVQQNPAGPPASGAQPERGGRHHRGNREDRDHNHEQAGRPDIAAGSHATNEQNVNESLEVLARRRADKHGRVAVLSVSAGFVPFALNWACHVRQIREGQKEPRASFGVNVSPGEQTVTNYLFLAEDKVALQQLQAAGEPVYLDPTLSLPAGDSLKAAEYGQVRYQEMIHHRVGLVGRLLRAGLRVLVADIDAVWTADPFAYLSPVAPTAGRVYDLEAQLDEDGPYNVCGGFLYFSGTEASKQLWAAVEMQHERILKEMHAAEAARRPWDWDAMTEQKALSREIQARESQGTLVWTHLDRTLFPSGRSYFTDRAAFYSAWRASGKYPVIVHNNYIIGFANKKARFQRAGLWALDETRNDPTSGLPFCPYPRSETDNIKKLQKLYKP
eukprot:TRINITY_DN1803_c0_g2_i2.p1 TRINITY_DN1803_c0_g2~~TRINITY_DN1803_c0_g2_i2.p1  ORF type:complete len:456 (-),score=52.31 TRINITY_DN1803_c0_g2_i2:1016-2383(-)